MHVGRVMQTELVTVSADTSLTNAKKIIEEKKIAHLLIVDADEKLLGIVSDRDLKQSWASPATSLSVHELNYLLNQMTVGMIMISTPITVTPSTTIERAARIMQENRISALPVVENDQLAGIITTTDVMEVLLQAIGIDTDSARFTVLVKDRVGVMAEISELLKNEGVSIRSLVTWPERKHPGLYQLVMRVPAKNEDQAIEALQKEGFKVLTEYVDDFASFLPED
ncbi:MAG: CBS and ACT domain-containing protein [Desulfobacterales bacterium]|nr:CBS and ACT domain-containing protein [Desulfobacterales bacterium]